jgi:glutathione S-transferase
LDNELKNKKWIVGDDISLADIITAALLTPLFLLSFDKSF